MGEDGTGLCLSLSPSLLPCSVPDSQFQPFLRLATLAIHGGHLTRVGALALRLCLLGSDTHACSLAVEPSYKPWHAEGGWPRSPVPSQLQVPLKHRVTVPWQRCPMTWQWTHACDPDQLTGRLKASVLGCRCRCRVMSASIAQSQDRGQCQDH